MEQLPISLNDLVTCTGLYNPENTSSFVKIAITAVVVSLELSPAAWSGVRFVILSWTKTWALCSKRHSTQSLQEKKGCKEVIEDEKREVDHC